MSVYLRWVLIKALAAFKASAAVEEARHTKGKGEEPKAIHCRAEESVSVGDLFNISLSAGEWPK